MTLFLFILIGWIFIIIFALIPKSLSIIENFIIFFCITVTELNIFTIFTLNLKLFEYSKIPKMFISVWVERNIVTPLYILILINLLFSFKEGWKKIGIIAIALLVLTLIELLSVWTGIKIYILWKTTRDITIFLISIALSYFLTRWLKSIG